MESIYKKIIRIMRQMMPIYNHPNPIKNLVTFEYGAKNPENLFIDIFNVKGQIQYTIQVLNQTEREGEISMKASDTYLPNGIYIYRLRQGIKTLATNKLIVIK
jgi:hypothetical protein